MRTPRPIALVLPLVLALSTGAFASEEEPAPPKGPKELAGLKYRLVGPPAGGRVSRVAGVPGDPLTYYAATASGGVWKSKDGGIQWKPVFDDQPTSSIGSIAVVRAAETGETEIGGLFACGEILWGLHGANRLGGNALTECIVTGALAGRFAAERALGSFPMPACTDRAKQVVRPEGVGGLADYRDIRGSLRDAAWSGAGIVRAEGAMREALSSLDEIEERLGRLAPQTVKERLLDCDLRAGALTLQAILQAGIGRKESRGSFLRSDHAGQDDAGWRRKSCLKYDEGSRSFTASYLPVEET